MDEIDQLRGPLDKVMVCRDEHGTTLTVWLDELDHDALCFRERA